MGDIMPNVLLIGSGGREHTLAWKLYNEGHKIFAAPGNTGTALIGTNIDLNPLDFDVIMKFVRDEKIRLTIPGPEAPLVEGIVDAFYDSNMPKKGHFIFGPVMNAARLEGSKIYTRMCCNDWNVPQPQFTIFNGTGTDSHMDRAANYLKTHREEIDSQGIVLKSDGLCGGKGVIVCDNYEQSITALATIHEKGWARRFLIEERLQGVETSITAIADGGSFETLIDSQDHKRRFDETGKSKHQGPNPNTGGMGAYAPTNLITPALEQVIEEGIIGNIITGMEVREKTPFKGVLYAGLMITKEGAKLIEINCRFGDPETQVVIPLLDSSLYELMMASIRGDIDSIDVKNKDQCAAHIVLAANTYPESGSKGVPIYINPDLADSDHTLVFHAGTKKEDDKLVTAGGRVLGITSLGPNHDIAFDRAYTAVQQDVRFDGNAYRSDLGYQVRNSLL